MLADMKWNINVHDQNIEIAFNKQHNILIFQKYR